MEIHFLSLLFFVCFKALPLTATKNMFERFKKAANPASEMSFLEHLEALRWHLVRSAIVVFIGHFGFCIQRHTLR